MAPGGCPGYRIVPHIAVHMPGAAPRGCGQAPALHVNEGAEMPISMPTAEHRETMTASTGIIDRAATMERVVTRSGRVSVPPARLVQEMGTAAMEVEPQELCLAEVSFLVALTDMADQGEECLDNEIVCVSAGLGSAGMSSKDELGCVGAGLGGGFDHMSELHVMKFKQAMKLADKENWEKAVNEEHK